MRDASRAPSAATGGSPGPARHRASPNHRYIVVRDGGRAGNRATRPRSRSITRPSGAPAAQSRSASRRNSGQEYDPGR